MNFSISLSTIAAEGELQVSKFQKIAILFDAEEMDQFFEFLKNQLGEVYLIAVHGKCKKDEVVLSISNFCSLYKNYVSFLCKGMLPTYNSYAFSFSNILTLDPNIVYGIPLTNEKILIKPKSPVVQMQPNHLQYSKEDGSFRTQVYGSGSITWGILFSYPQLFQSNVTHAIEPIRDEFINTALFTAIRRWTRDHTLPTRFLVNGNKTATSIRLGKKCQWINEHPQLLQENLKVILKEE